MKNNARILAILAALTLIFRLAYIYYSWSDKGRANWIDDLYYLSMGEQIASGNWQPISDGKPQMIVGPVIPLLVAAFILLFSDPIVPFFIFNALVTSFTVVLLFYIGKELFNEPVGWLLCIWGILFADHFKYLLHVLKEPLLYLLVPLVFWLFVKSVKKPASKNLLFLTALSYAFLIHTDERFLVYFPVFILGFLLTKPLKFRGFIKSATLFSIFTILLMLPWGIRNYVVFDQVVIISPRTTVFTSKLWGENLEATSSHFADENSRMILNESRMQRALEFGKTHGITPREQGIKEARLKALINFWQPTYFQPTFIQYGYRIQLWSLQHNMSGLLFYGIFLPFYFIGLFFLFKRRNPIGLFVAFIPIIHSLLHAYMVWPLERYRSPVTFIVVMVGIWSLIILFGNSISKKVYQNLNKRYK
jgi:4-amino-4-deoxy-L-arabinose transferase-like glycosyltransferase